jgi:hypothetical protein
MSSNKRREDAELRRAVRAMRVSNRLGEDAQCATCGDTFAIHLARAGGITVCACCLAVGRGRDIFERHHIAGEHEGQTVEVCANCHCELTELQRDWPKSLGFDERFALGLDDIRSLRKQRRPQ